jgi:hypothetical protein
VVLNWFSPYELQQGLFFSLNVSGQSFAPSHLYLSANSESVVVGSCVLHYFPVVIVKWMHIFIFVVFNMLYSAKHLELVTTLFFSTVLAYFLPYILTYSTEQRPSWKANRSSASQEMTLIVWNLKVHYHIHKSVSLVLILSQIDSFGALYPTSRRFILILSSHLHLGLPSGLHP